MVFPRQFPFDVAGIGAVGRLEDPKQGIGLRVLALILFPDFPGRTAFYHGDIGFIGSHRHKFRGHQAKP